MIKEENINCTVEALVLASPEPVSIKKLSEAIDDIPTARVRQAVDDLNNIYMGCGSSFRIREVAGGYQVHILPDFEQPIKKLLVKQRTVRLSRAALETLAIIAYKQPVTKIDIEHIRGVASDGVIHNLLQRSLVIISGRAETPGRPLLYKTSNEFLKFFGLNRLSDLPRLDEIEEMIRQADGPKEQTVLPLNGKEEQLVDDDFDEDEIDSGNGDLNLDNMVASADISDLMSGVDLPAEVNAEDTTPAGDNGNGNGNGNGHEENIAEFIVTENIDQPETLPIENFLAENENLESEKVVDAAGHILPGKSILDYYEPLTDEPPVISEIGDTTDEPGNDNGDIREPAIESDEEIEVHSEQVDTGQPTPEN